MLLVLCVYTSIYIYNGFFIVIVYFGARKIEQLMDETLKSSLTFVRYNIV